MVLQGKQGWFAGVEALTGFSLYGKIDNAWEKYVRGENSMSHVNAFWHVATESGLNQLEAVSKYGFYRHGDIVVFNLKGRDIPIVHRVLEIHETKEKQGRFRILTKGDNNEENDRALYNPKQLWLLDEDLSGKIVAYLPYVGYVTIMMNDYPQLKYALLGIMAIFVLTGKGE